MPHRVRQISRKRWALRCVSLKRQLRLEGQGQAAVVAASSATARLAAAALAAAALAALAASAGSGGRAPKLGAARAAEPPAREAVAESGAAKRKLDETSPAAEDAGSGRRGGHGEDGRDNSAREHIKDKGQGKGKTKSGGLPFFGRWEGPKLGTKVFRDVRLAEGSGPLGIELRFPQGGGRGEVVEVDASAEPGQSANVGDHLLRVNGLDTSMLTEQQVKEMLQERPSVLRFGEP
mmetsp:Transcript_102109/g.287085  ORF Transcript_102109/g.287085 Transcript_102109/m.287085 type:complete len:235 (-) Transcript_102109:81-785(-)